MVRKLPIPVSGVFKHLDRCAIARHPQLGELVAVPVGCLVRRMASADLSNQPRQSVTRYFKRLEVYAGATGSLPAGARTFVPVQSHLGPHHGDLPEATGARLDVLVW